MNRLVAPPTHSEPSDCRGLFSPVRIHIGHRPLDWCHRCGDLASPDLLHLVDSEGAHLCKTCLQLLNPALRRGLEALNRLARALNQPWAYSATYLVREWRAAVDLARPEEAHLLQSAAQILASHVGYRPTGLTHAEIT